jgi:hypothetical protein
MRKAIISCIQGAKEHFAPYFERFRALRVKCPHHGIPLWRQCQIIYDGVSSGSRSLLEARCQGNFVGLRDFAAWALLEDLVEKSMDWE